MKKNDYLLLTATGAYSFLFYQQNAGINFLLFTILLILILVLKNVKLLKSITWLFFASLCLLSGISVFVHSSALSIIGNVFSLFLLSAVSFNISTSVIFSLLFSVYSVLSSVVYIIMDTVTRMQPEEPGRSTGNGGKILATLLVVLLSLGFFAMYQNSNPLFAENTKWLNLDFVSAHWIFFTLGGFLLVYAFIYHRTITPVEAWENARPLWNKTALTNELNQKQFETERYAGLLLFVVLNIMLLILNAGDIQTLYFNGGLPENVSHSDFVHSGVGITIMSVIIATSLIMYLFRKEFIDVKNNKGLMTCVYIWIIQNILMLSSTAIRNQLYIQEFNFTYKRVGVYVWLALTMLGLCIMFFKIYRKRSNWYLIRTNVALWFSVLVIAGCFNWDVMITRYNLKNKPLHEVDLYYLFSLSDANIPELLARVHTKEFVALKSKCNGDDTWAQTYIRLLNDKLSYYLSGYTNDWRSYDLRDKRILESMYQNK